MYKSVVKRIIDFLGALILLLVLFPVMLIVAISIKLDSKGPVLFVQKRSGKGDKIFNMYKFRSMAQDNDVHDFSKENKPTKVGNFIRKTSLDELPQLINILKGEMSFIGPRPWIEDYSKYFTKNQKRRLEVLPGITGLAQAKGRNDLSIKEKINLDIEYVDNLTFIMDIKVIIGTIKTVLSKQGAEISKSGIEDEITELKNQWNKEKTNKKLNKKTKEKVA